MSRFVIITPGYVLKGRIKQQSQILWSFGKVFNLSFNLACWKILCFKSSMCSHTSMRDLIMVTQKKRPDDMHVSSGCFFKICRTHM